MLNVTPTYGKLEKSSLTGALMELIDVFEKTTALYSFTLQMLQLK